MVEYPMRMSKTISKISLSICFLALCTSGIFAFSYYSAKTQKYDTTLSEQDIVTYSNPTVIYISQVTTSSSTLAYNPTKWVKSLYYYCITRLKLANVPYTYLVDENGIIYQGNSNSIGANTGIKDTSGVVLIGYLSNKSSLTARAKSSLKEMIEKISYDWGISEIKPVKLYITKNKDTLSTLTATQETGEFAQSITEALANWTGYTEEHLEYKAKIKSVNYTKEIQIGERAKITVEIENQNDFIWFTDKSPIYLAKKDGKDSEFAINGEWLSFSKPTAIMDKSVMPGETITLEFEMEGKYSLGEVSETFVLTKEGGEAFTDTNFDITLNVIQGDLTLVQVASSQYGFANIRECASQNCKIIDSVENGALFILLEQNDSGWSKVKFGQNTEGWVVSRFLKQI